MHAQNSSDIKTHTIKRYCKRKLKRFGHKWMQTYFDNDFLLFSILWARCCYQMYFLIIQMFFFAIFDKSHWFRNWLFQNNFSDPHNLYMIKTIQQNFLKLNSNRISFYEDCIAFMNQHRAYTRDFPLLWGNSIW